MGSRWLFAVFLFLLVFLVVGLNWCWKYETVTSTNGQPIDNRLLVDSSTVAVDGSSASPIYEFPSIYRGGFRLGIIAHWYLSTRQQLHTSVGSLWLEMFALQA